MKHFSKKIKPHFITCEDLKTCGTFFTSQDQEDKERAASSSLTFALFTTFIPALHLE